MAELRTEEEQIEAIKNWWKENGRSTVVGVVVAALAVFGWRGWQDYQRETAETASALYQSMVQQAAVQPGQVLTEEASNSVSHIANRLKNEFDGSSYAQFAALWLAKIAAEQGQLDTAKQELEWVLSQEPKDNVAQVVKFRLAQVLLAQNNAEAGLQQLGSTPLQGFEAAYFELKGDLLLALGRQADARQAYQSGQQANVDNARPLLAMKLDDLAEQENH